MNETKYILDACSLIAFINDEQGAEKVEDILKRALNNIIEVFMNKINVYEVYYGICRDEGKQKADDVYYKILKQPINIIEKFEDDVLFEAAMIKTKYKMSLADSIILGEGIVKNAIIVSSDHHEFDIVEKKENIKFDWIR